MKRESNPGMGVEDARWKKILNFLPSSIFLLPSCLFFFTLVGCGPKYTYPADTVPQAIESICAKEYKLDVQARAIGKTAGALYYVDDILDDKGQIPKDIHEKMGQVMQVVTRVALSTDLPLDFCVVVIRDRSHMNELVITRSIDDTKRAQSDAIGIEESINRTLFGQGKYQPEAEGEKSFALKEVRLGNFLSEQIAQRIRFSFVKDLKGDNPQQPFVLVDGVFNQTETDKKFRFSVLSLKSDDPRETMIQVLRTINDVLKGYSFTDYSTVEILDYLNRQKMDIPKQVLIDYQQKKITEQEIMDRYLSESSSVQEAFKLFGFNLSDSTDTAEAPPIATATP